MLCAMAPRITLITGPEAILVDRAVSDVVAAIRKDEKGAEKRTIMGSEEATGLIADGLAPTLFGDPIILVIRGIEMLDDDGADLIKSALGDLPDGVWLVLVHGGGVKGKTLLTAVRASGAAEIECPELKRGRDTIDFLTKEFAKRKRSATRDAVAALYDSVGHDLRLLVAAVTQLMDDVQTNPIELADVRNYFGGVAEVSSFAIADAVWNKDPIGALAKLRWSAETMGRSAVGPATVAALAGGLRSLVAIAAVPPGVSDQIAAKEAGVPPWKVKTLRQQRQRWRGEQLAAAAVRLADADAAMKGGLGLGANLDPGQKMLALERLVVDIAAGR